MGCGASAQGGSPRSVTMPVRLPEVHPDAPVQEILEVMRSYSQLVGLQEEACQTLGNRATNEEFVEKLVAERGIEVILKAMRNHSHHSGLQGQACAALYSLAGNASCRFQLTAAGGIHDVLSAMRNFSNFIAVQHRCLAALSQLAIELDGANQIVKEGGVGDIVQAMRANPDHAGLQEAACYTIWSITQHRKQEFQIEVGAQSGVQTIIQAIQNHTEIGVQEKACLALFNIALDENNAALIFKEGGVTAVLSAMRKHQKEVLVQQAACALLKNLSRGNTEQRQTLADLSAVADVLAAMKIHRSSAPVQLHAAQAICTMADEAHAHARSPADSPSNSPIHAAAEQGSSMLTEEEDEQAIKELVAGMRELREQKEVQRCFLRALSALLLRAGHKQTERLTEEGGIELLVALMEQHSEEPELLVAACTVISNASDHGQFSQQFGAGSGAGKGGIAAVLAGMRAHQGHSALQEESCRVLCKLANTNSAEILDGGGAREVVAAMQRHADAEHVQEQGCGALAGLVAGPGASDPQRIAELKNEGVPEAVARAMEGERATEQCIKWGGLVQGRLAA